MLCIAAMTICCNASKARQMSANAKEDQSAARPIPAAPSGSAPTPIVTPTVSESQLNRDRIYGARSLGCTVKRQGADLSVSCEGTSTTGQPEYVKGIEPYVARSDAANGIIVATISYAVGTRSQTVFQFKNRSYTLSTEWPAGQAEPDVLGVFDGAEDPRVIPLTASQRKLRWTTLEQANLDPSQFDDRGCGGILAPGEKLGPALARSRRAYRRMQGFQESLDCAPRPWRQRPNEEDCRATLNVRSDSPEGERAIEVWFSVERNLLLNTPPLVCFLAG
jgi:hypothetical protein